ncbi:MAG TPA: hypothetical protein VFI84_03975 [Candidatus Saccharimonadales bacterium]|nr:hypothetical protein [Candidatus Saccharimonadales bacterium]
MAAKILPFPGNHEYRHDPEDDRIVRARDEEVDESVLRYLRPSVWAENPRIILEEDKIETPEVPAQPASLVVESAINSAAAQERRKKQEQTAERLSELSDAERRAAEARSVVDEVTKHVA